MQKKIYLWIASLLLAFITVPTFNVSAQYDSVTFKPGTPGGSVNGEDVSIVTTFGCSPYNLNPYYAENLSWDDPRCDMLGYGSWTIGSLGCSATTSRALIRFSEMNTLPCDANIQYAELRLFGVSSSGCSPAGNSDYPSTPFSDNSGYIERVIVPWNESTVTWNNLGSPATTNTNQTASPNSTSQWNYNMTVDVTYLTQDILREMRNNVANNNGYMIKLQNESYYRNMVFASSEDGNSSLWPELFIRYDHSYCNANFGYCSSSPYPNTFDFSANEQCFNTYEWDFGDGTGYFYGANIRHTYTFAGTFSVVLNVRDGMGNLLCSVPKTICVNTVNAAPSPGPITGTGAQFTYCSNTTDPSTYVLTPLDPTYPGPVTTYEWDLGNGTIITVPGTATPGITYSYPASGNFTICLNMRDVNNVLIYQDCIPICQPQIDPIMQTNTNNTKNMANGNLNITDHTVQITKIYPNPAQTVLNVDLKLTKNNNILYKVYNITGSEVLHGERAMKTGNQKCYIPVAELASGIYMLEINDGNSVVKQKFTKE